MMTPHRYSGSCLCGRVKYEIMTAPESASHCHCLMCRKQHGAAFATYANVSASAHRFVYGSAHISRYKSSDKAVRSFCSFCGTPLLWQRLDEKYCCVSFPLSTLDDLVEFPPLRHIHVASKAPWYDIHDELPKQAAD